MHLAGLPVGEPLIPSALNVISPIAARFFTGRTGSGGMRSRSGMPSMIAVTMLWTVSRVVSIAISIAALCACSMLYFVG
jgi:hypothetical protein